VRYCRLHPNTVLPSYRSRGTTGCSVCNKEYRNKRKELWDSKFIPCFNHPNRRAERSRNYCSYCASSATKKSLLKTRPKREQRWQSEFIPCKRHPERRANRSMYVISGSKECGSCINKPHGQPTKAHLRALKRDVQTGLRAAREYGHARRKRLIEMAVPGKSTWEITL